MSTTEALDIGTRRRSLSLRKAWSVFWRHPSPTLLVMAVTGSVTARLVVADWSLWDLWIPLIMIALFPFYEWVIHVVLLHWKPIKLGRIRLDPDVSRKHRAHHADPRDIPLVFIPLGTLLAVLPVDIAIALFAFPTLAMGLTFFVTLASIGLVYEWMHYLIHSDYRPQSRVYRAIWRNHRLHHYKNEKYWFTVTTANTADVILRTNPDATAVETSPTARDLLGEGLEPAA